MTLIRRIRLALLFVVTPLCMVQASLAATEAGALKDSLVAAYPLTKVGVSGFQFNYNRITQPGVVLNVRIPGIFADVADTKQIPLTTNITGGVATQQTGFLAGLNNTKQGRQLQPNETVFATRLEVKGDTVRFELITENTFPVTVMGSTEQKRYRSEVVFHFPNGSLATMDPAEVKKTIDTALLDKTAPIPVESKTISLGMSTADVKKSLGNPDKIVELGEKEIYVYKDMRVIFKADQVADVQ
jgi:hypothetical protein